MNGTRKKGKSTLGKPRGTRKPRKRKPCLPSTLKQMKEHRLIQRREELTGIDIIFKMGEDTCTVTLEKKKDVRKLMDKLVSKKSREQMEREIKWKLSMESMQQSYDENNALGCAYRITPIFN